MKKYPECDKQLAVKDQSQAIGEFIEWLKDNQGITFSKTVPKYKEYYDKDFEKKINKLGEDSIEAKALRLNNMNKWGDAGGLVVDRRSIEQLLADYFKIDLKKVEQEKQEMLDDMRSDQ